MKTNFFFDIVEPPFLAVVKRRSHSAPFSCVTGETADEIYARKCLPHPDEDWPAGPSMPLMKRGRAFQERSLSRRFCVLQLMRFCGNVLKTWLVHARRQQRDLDIMDSLKTQSFLTVRLLNPEFAMGDLPKEKLCELWRELAAQLYEAGAYFTLRQAADARWSGEELSGC